MLTLVPEEIERYASACSTATPELYERLREETYRDASMPQMQVGHLVGRLLKLLVQIAGAGRAVEVGTFTGYSALCIAEGLAPDGTLVTCDVDPVATAIARRYFALAPWGSKIDLRLGDARETLRGIDGPIDFAFIDADKPGYVDYWEALVPKVRPGGLLVADNVLWSGRVLDPRKESDRALAAFNAHVHDDGRVDAIMLPVRDGLTVARRR
jgi:caffeoyl-CoA O-methyltransferase